MFLQQNTLEGLREYFNKSVSNQFSESEIKLMFKAFVTMRMELSNTEFMLNRVMSGGEVRFSESDLLYFRSVVKRLQANEPFQYIHGKTEFYGLELLCDKRALIPRPETEELVDWILESLNPEENCNIIDICSGSGCIALALKSVLKHGRVEAWELSDEALELINENQALTGLNITSIKMDALSNSYPASAESVDVIVSNPPYIPNAERSRMHANVLDFEPEMALFVDDANPSIFYESIASTSFNLLIPYGWLYFEIHEDFETEMAQLFENHGFVNIELRKDLQGRSRMMRGQRVPSHHE